MVTPVARRTVAAIFLPMYPPKGVTDPGYTRIFGLVTPLRATSIGR
jgi:hypothetical protein